METIKFSSLKVQELDSKDLINIDGGTPKSAYELGHAWGDFIGNTALKAFGIIGAIAYFI